MAELTDRPRSTLNRRGVLVASFTQKAGRLCSAVLLAVVSGVAATMTGGMVGPLPPAAAHTDLVSSVPAPQTRLTKAPAELRLTFSEKVEPTFTTVALAIGGGPSRNLSTRVTGGDVWATSPTTDSPTKDQEWKVAYRVVSTDGHPVSGTFTFVVVGAPDETTTSGAKTTPSPNFSSTTGGATPIDSAERDPSRRLNLPLAMAALLALVLLTPILIARRRRKPQHDPPNHNKAKGVS